MSEPTENDREWAALVDSDQYNGDLAAVIADYRAELEAKHQWQLREAFERGLEAGKLTGECDGK